MRFEIEPDPAYPLGGHALLILPEGASAGSGRLTLRRRYDNRHLEAEGWQAARTTLGPFELSGRGSAPVVALGPQVVAHLAEFDALEIEFEGGDKGSAVWPDTVLLPPGVAAAGGLHRGQWPEEDSNPAVSFRGTPLPEHQAELQPELPVKPPTEPPPKPPARPPSRASNKWPIGLAIAAVIVGGIFVAISVIDVDGFFGGTDPKEEIHTDCAGAAFAADREASPASQIERVRRCAGVEGASPEARLAAVERLLSVSPEALVVMGRWYDPVHRDEDHSPFGEPAIETAARYYFEGKEAGAAGAEALLRDVCARLDPKNLMQGNARQLYCPQR